MRLCVIPVIFCGYAALSGCAVGPSHARYQTVEPAVIESYTAARQANERGLGHAHEGQWPKAEAAFREALRIDMSYAAAHNNLGLVLLHQGKFYEAALEFKFASKLDKRAAEPIANLGRLYEAVGWKDAAEKQFREAAALGQRTVESGRSSMGEFGNPH